MRIYTDDNGVAVNAISRTAAQEEVEGHLYQVLHGAGVTELQFQKGNPQVDGVNGMTSEALLAVLIHRTEVLNNQFPCEENINAIAHFKLATGWFEQRTRNRQKRGVEGKEIA